MTGLLPLKIAIRIVAGLAISLLHLWALAALWIDGLCILVYIALLFGCAFRIRRLPPALLCSLIPFVAVLLWWSTLSPSNEREWMGDVSRVARAEIDGDRLTIHNVRNFDYTSETDYVERWETRTYDLSKLRGVDMFLSTWGSPYIAHTIVSWDFGDGNQLAISIETRKEKGEAYSAILGFFRQFELYYVVADERDVIRLRSNFRGESVRLYALTTPVETARRILLDYFAEINALVEEPEWYNALTHNCTTTIRHHAQHVAKGNPFDWRIIVNGSIDELGYERGTVDTSLPFEELRRVSDIDERAREANDAPDFSKHIRVGLPGGHAPVAE